MTEPTSDDFPERVPQKPSGSGILRLILGIVAIFYGCAMIFLGIRGIPIFRLRHQLMNAPWEGEAVGLLAIMVGSVLIMSVRTARK